LSAKIYNNTNISTNNHRGIHQELVVLGFPTTTEQVLTSFVFLFIEITLFGPSV